MDQANVLRNKIRMKNETMSTKPKQQSTTSARVITVTSGKGGVGKTNFATNLAINFIKNNKKVIIIDADFGLANIEVLLGAMPKYNLGDIFSGEKNIEEIICESSLGIKFISGGSGLRKLANMSDSQMKFILNAFSLLDQMFDIIIVDTGAGISDSVLNFVSASEEIIIVTTPEPTAITDAYAIIKTITEMKVQSHEFKIVVNKVENQEEGEEIYQKLFKVSDQFLGTKLQNLGYIPEDSQLVRAVKRQQPVTVCYPNSNASKAIMRISDVLLEKKMENPSAGILMYLRNLMSIFKD